MLELCILHLWLLLSLCLTAGELIHSGLFFTLPFAGGAFAAACTSIFEFSLLAQIGVFITSSLTLFFVLHRWNSKKNAHAAPRTNSSILIGKSAVVVIPIENSTTPGYVKLRGELWLAYTCNNRPCPAGSFVQVIDIQGCHLIVQHKQT
jgi:membrane protein implicated in regulation of membrane protease activity